MPRHPDRGPFDTDRNRLMHTENATFGNRFEAVNDCTMYPSPWDHQPADVLGTLDVVRNVKSKIGKSMSRERGRPRPNKHRR